MKKENGIKRLNRISVKAKEYRDENTQVVKLSQAIEVIELIDQVDQPDDYFEIAFERGNKLIELGQKIKEMQTERQEMKQEINRLKNNQLDEPEKVVVPQFVADWIEESKSKPLRSLFTTFAYIEEQRWDMVPKEIWNFISKEPDNDEVFAKAWLYGYVVEETLYYMPLPYQSNNTIYYYKQDDGKISFKQGGMMKDHSKFTQEELDKYFPEIKHMAEEVRNE
ncbi:DUF1642 domain-containing protein [Marinilactibacillus psychrotolerans]|uniref:DUF1642 domain-containing protein n=1 Tax=Marinilactibacillus psychrotolerans TaxID=191770 RepID=A0A5R9BVZ0_9LACT|nr:DUF1642 domain-containing protein [Marinilactibacillus psychrotolerans]TLQ04735.1 DUF1642 domain-containing protein [Marinilactibacillus psychrotolerans]